MLNFLHSRLKRPEKGWDPVSPQTAIKYAAAQWSDLKARDSTVKRISELLGGLTGKKILDLGGGPGQYSVAFAERGAHVFWHDISRNYLKIAAQKAAEAGVTVNFSIGYLEDIPRYAPGPYDLVFCRLNWLYCMNDRKFSRLILSVLSKEGLAYVWANTLFFEISQGNSLPLGRRLRYWLYWMSGYKIGHLHPKRGVIASAFKLLKPASLDLDYSRPDSDVIIVRK